MIVILSLTNKNVSNTVPKLIYLYTYGYVLILGRSCSRMISLWVETSLIRRHRDKVMYVERQGFVSSRNET